ncbi:MAG: SRPBCC family protein [Gammaproteobacteria bacterium]|nr:SRPBCC family protein [Gammaproteobacteria bacterium]
MLPALTVAAAELRAIDVERKKGHILVASETFIDAPPDAVFEILADYEGFHRISKVFTETRYLERDEIGNGVVYSRAVGCVLFFCTEIERVETLTLTPGREILAIAIPEKSDVDFSVARWVFEQEGSGTRLLYGVEFKPGFWIPPVLGPMIIRAKLRSRGIDAANRIEQLANASQIHSASP